jgi:hypothetical protein
MQKFTPEQWEGLLRRLKNGGCPVRQDHGYKMPPLGLAIEKVPGISFSQIFDLQAGGTGYAIEFVLRNELDRPIDVQGFQIRTPWGIPRVSLLPAPRKSSCVYPHYILPDRSRYFEAGFVLNPIFARQNTRLKPREEVEGVLVALDEAPIPTEIQNLERVMLTLVIFDSRGNSYSEPFSMQVDRSALHFRELAKERWARKQPKRSPKRAERKSLAGTFQSRRSEKR